LDLLMVYEPSDEAAREELARFSGAFQTALRDLGLKVGLALRTPEECVRLAQADVSVASSMLYARLLWGEDEAARLGLGELGARVADALRGKDKGIGFASGVLQEVRERHERFGQTVYLLEPDVKHARGGLRDLHAFLWVARVLYGVSELHKLDLDKIARQAGATAQEAAELQGAADFVYLVRAALHHGERFGNDRLTFPHQQRIAKRLGFADDATAQRTEHRGLYAVERFMQRFYREADALATLAMRWQEMLLLPEDDARPALLMSGVCVRQGRVDLVRRADFLGESRVGEAPGLQGGAAFLGLQELSAEAEGFLRRNPLGVAEVALEHGLPLHPAVEGHLARAARLELGSPSVAAFSLRRLLSSTDTSEGLLASLARCGLFERLLPEFEPITALAQHDVYHVYTVDAHLRRAWGLGRAGLAGQWKGEGPLWERLRGLAAAIPVHRRQVLLLGCLLHDVGKGRGGDHSVLGAGLSDEIGVRLGLTDVQRERLRFLVLEHLLLPKVSQRRNLDDEEVIRNVAGRVRTLGALEDLTFLSAVDMMAVGPDNFTDWKGQLLFGLYDRVRRVLEQGIDALWRRDEELAERRVQVASVLGEEASAQEVERFFGALPARYLLKAQPKELAAHLRLWARPEAVATSLMPGSAQGCTQVALCAPEWPGTLAVVAGVLAGHGLNILQAQAYPVLGGRGLVLVEIQTASGRALTDERRQARVLEELSGALWAQVEPRTLAPKVKDRGLDRPTPQVPTVVKVDQVSSRASTTLEVQTRDRLGLLWNIARVLYEAGCRVHVAKITTEGARAIDAFSIDRADPPHGPLTEEEAEALRRSLAQALEADDVGG
jgi:[protein-PII] uridylyltransferase